MNVRQTRTLIHLTSVAFLAGTAGIVAWGFSAINENESVPPKPIRQRTSIPDQERTSAASRSLAQHWQRKLRQPLVDPPKPKPKPLVIKPLVKQPAGVPKPTKIDITLVGTILEPGRDVGVFADTSGGIDLKPVGKILDLEPKGVRVEKISETKATVSLQGRKQTLEIVTAKKSRKSEKKKRLK